MRKARHATVYVVCFLVKKARKWDEMQISVLLFAYRNTVSHRKSGKWLGGQGHE